MSSFWKMYGPGLVLLGGVTSISVGAGMIYMPAGLIAAGVLAIAWWVLDSMDGGDSA